MLPSGGLCAPAGSAPPCTVSVTTSVTTPPLLAAQLRISKTANTNTLQPNGSVIYTITVSNTGTVAVTNATISDLSPAGIVAFAWTWNNTGGATCPTTGSGALADRFRVFRSAAR